jgi:hypothetical protein
VEVGLGLLAFMMFLVSFLAEGALNSIADSTAGPGTCTDYVANNATAFTNSYWEFGTFSIYNGIFNGS